MSNNKRQRRGVLALFDGALPRYPYDPNLLLETTHAMRRRGSRAKPSSVMPPILEEFPKESEWILLFLADSHNLNSIRFRPILVDFVQQSHGECHCICIPNRQDEQDLLCGGTGFMCLPWTHENRSGVIRLVSAVEVPCVIVIENATGRRLTDRGMVAIESNDSQEVLKRWRLGESGLTLGQSSCCVS